MSKHLRNGKFYLELLSQGKAVEFVQSKLEIEVNGKFEMSTKTAVRKYQGSRGLAVDGIVGPVTFTALAEKVLRIEFDRTQKNLVVELDGLGDYGISQIYSCKAISGLPPGHKRTKQLIDQGRDDLDITTDYRLPKYDDVSDAGPIPDGGYDLPLKAGMPYQKTGGGWGVGGWYLDPGRASRIGYRFGWNRGGFFLHHDGNGEGTGGCIGVTAGRDMKNLKSILTEQEKNFTGGKVAVKVK